MNKFNNVISYLYGTAWAMMPEKLTAILNFIDQKAEGMTFTKEELEGRFGALSRPSARTQGSIAVIPVFGVIGQRMNLINDFSGGTSTEKLTKQIEAAANDSTVKAIVLDVDSPGGTVGGVPELSKVIFDAREKKHIVAVANSLMASAAFWLGTAADEVVVTPSGEVGSIGVFSAHQDISQLNENVGIKTTLISAGKFKVEGNPFEPLGDEAREAIQSDVDEFFNMFILDVARNRGKSASEVKNGFGQGRVVGAKEAVKTGMVDRIATLDQTIERLRGSTPSQTMKAIKPKGWTESDLTKEIARVFDVPGDLLFDLDNKELANDEPSTRQPEPAKVEPKTLDIELENRELDLLKF